MNEKLLESAGLTKLEIKVYLAILDLGSALVGVISRKSGAHRRSVYDVLDRLIEKGLVSYILTNNRRYYQATNPERLTELIKEKQNNIAEILPELMLKFNLAKEKQETNFFRGKEGLKTIFYDQLNEGKTICIIGGSEQAAEVIRYFFEKYDKERIRKKIKVKILFSREAKSKIKRIPLSEIRFLPEGFGGLASTNIYGNKVAIIVWSRTNPLGILIKQKEVAESYLKYFELLWKIGKH